jgi:cardiolipin synthase A/B
MGMSPTRRAFAILGVVAAVIAFVLMIAQDRETLKIRSTYGIEDPRAASYFAALIGAPLTHGNDYDVLTNGDQIFPAMLEAIRGAKRRVSFESYVFEPGAVADQFIAAFEEAARRGVHVSLTIDSVGGSAMTEEAEARLKQAGCRTATFNSPKWYSLENVNNRTHRKILVVDGEIGFTGGVGVADHWLGHAEDKEHWRDTQFRMRGPIVRLLEAAFYENFTEAAEDVTPELDEAPAPLHTDGASVLVRSSPTGGSNDLKRVYLLGIGAAHRTIDITSPYFVTDESTQWALEEAVKRGVKIRILVEGKITDALPVKYASRESYDHLLALGIEIYEYQPTMMHTKVLVVDGTWTMFGSANFDNRSLELNDELNVSVTKPDLGRRVLDDFEQDLRSSTRLELSRWRQRSLLEKTREQFWSYFGEVF